MVDLFAGTGAFTHAFQSTGQVECVFANDMVEASKKIYDANFTHTLTLENLNDVKVEDIPAHDILTGGFPCFVEGTRVLTNSGYKAIEKVEDSDLLFTHTGSFQRILNKQIKHGSLTLHSINTQYHPHTIQCTEEHPFYVRERVRTWNNDRRRYTYTFNNPEWLSASKLTENHFTGLVINTDSIIPFELNKPDQWFMMGYFLGDGWIETKNKIRFAINTKDKEYVVNRISSVLNITDKKCSTGKSDKYGCANLVWWNILKDFGKYSHGKKIPEWVQQAPVEFIKEFLLGYQTADGCINSSSNGIKNHHIQYTTVSINIAYGIQRLYLKLGLLCSISYHIMPPKCIIEGRIVNQMNTYKLRVTINRQRLSSSFIEDGYAWFKIKTNISKNTNPLTVYNFEVEHDNSYCVENTIVHNCQPFSIAGNQEGFNDERSNVFWKILAIIDHHGPRCVVLENVKNLVSHDDGNTFQIIKQNLEDRGYHVMTKILDTSVITGVPQHRERIYIVCLKDRAVFDAFSLDFPTVQKAPVTSMLLAESAVPAKYYYTSTSSTWPLVSEAVTKKDTIYQYRRVYVRENKSNECPTLTANMGSGGHNVPIILDDKGIRKLTPRECFNFQGFPADYVLPALADSHLYKLAGNAVSVPVVQLIANRLVPLL